MKLACLISGGKDSIYACYKAMQKEEVTCLITVKSENKESYMFHTPNIDIVDMQAKAMELLLIEIITKGEKEKELDDLEAAIIQAKEKFGIEGIVTGAVKSTYQSVRIQNICDKLNLWCFNPVWQRDEEEYMKELLDEDFKIIISGIAAYSLTKEWLGKIITSKDIIKLKELNKKYSLSMSFEGGEAETTVINCPIFKKEIKILNSETILENEFTGNYIIKKAKLN